MKCPKDINDAYFRGELSLAEIDCTPWDSNYVEPEPEPEAIDVGGKLVEQRGVPRTVPTHLAEEPTGDDQTTDKEPCPCQVQNPLLWLVAGVVIGYALKK